MKIISAIVTIAFEDLNLRVSNSNLLLGKRAIWLEFLAQNRKTDKHITGAYTTNTKNFLQKPIFILGKHRLKLFFCIKIGLLQSLKNELLSKQLVR